MHAGLQNLDLIWEAMGRYQESGEEYILYPDDGAVKALSRGVMRPDLYVSEMQPGRDPKASELEAVAAGRDDTRAAMEEAA